MSFEGGLGSKVGPQHCDALEGAAVPIWTTTGTPPAFPFVSFSASLDTALHALSAVVGSKVGPQHRAALEGAAFAVWTTTGWTIPANLAVAVNDKLQYAVVEAQVHHFQNYKISSH